MIPLPWLVIGTSIALALTGGAAYLKGRNDGRALEFAERATLEEVARVASEAATQAAAKQIASITVRHTTIRQQAETVTREIPVYRDCRNDPAVVRLLDAARADRSTDEPTDPGSVPGARADLSQ